MALTPFLASIRQLIAENKLDAAIQQLHTLLENTPRLNEILQQSGRNAALKKHVQLGLVSFENATLNENQIRWGLLELISEIEKEGAKPELKEEAEQAISIINSKNVVVGNNTVGGNMYVGDTTHIHYHNGVEIPRLLTPPPIVPEIFLGRTNDLQRIHELLFAPHGNLLLLVNGEGGVGKTSIASKYFHTYQEQYAHAAWVFKDNSIADALLLLAVPLGLKFEDFWDNTQRLEVLLRAMANLKKPCLLIIDNANELNDLNAYLPQLQRCSNFHVLLTTRISEQGNTAQYKIEALPQDLALQAFKTHYKAFERQEEGLFFQIYEAVQGNTLVLELLAKNLNNFNNKLKKRYLLADLQKELESGLLHLSKTSTVDTRYQAKGTGLRNESIEVIIMAMYDLGELNPPESQLLSVFAVLPAESIPFTRLETLLPEYEDLDTHLLSLAQKGWMEYNAEAAAFKCSPVVQEVVRMKQADLLEKCASLIKALCTQLDTENLHLDNYQYSTVFVRFAEVVLNSLSNPAYDLVRLCYNIGNYFTATGDLNKAMTAYQKMETIQAELLEAQPDDPDFKNGLAISYTKLGSTHSALGNFHQALTFFEQSNELEKQLYAAYPQNVAFKNGLAISYQYLGIAHNTLGNLQQALTFFEKDLTVSEELYAAYPQNVSFKNGLAISYFQLGRFYRDHQKDLVQAKVFFQQCYQLWDELTEAYPDYVEFSDNFNWVKKAIENLRQ